MRLHTGSAATASSKACSSCASVPNTAPSASFVQRGQEGAAGTGTGCERSSTKQIHTHTHTNPNACPHTHTHLRILTQIRYTLVHSHTNLYTHAHYIYIHSQICTHTYPHTHSTSQTHILRAHDNHTPALRRSASRLTNFSVLSAGMLARAWMPRIGRKHCGCRIAVCNAAVLYRDLLGVQDRCVALFQNRLLFRPCPILCLLLAQNHSSLVAQQHRFDGHVCLRRCWLMVIAVRLRWLGCWL